jgi:hypothetical protein
VAPVESVTVDDFAIVMQVGIDQPSAAIIFQLQSLSG